MSTRAVQGRGNGEFGGIGFRVRRDLLACASSTALAGIPTQPNLRLNAAPAIPLSSNGRAATVSHLGSTRRYLGACAVLTAIAVGLVWNNNRLFAPEMYAEDGMLPAAEAFENGQNFATFDLNINIRKLRDFHIGQMKKTPDVVIFGASHWQEAHENLIPNQDFYNSHIHRDYWEDMFAVTEIWLKHNRLPKKIIISIRDNLFTPIDMRKDFLWEPGIPYWRTMAERLRIETEPYLKSLPYQRMRERFSLSMLFGNITRWYNAEELPHATNNSVEESLDILLPGGSIVWSKQHKRFFTQDRSRREALDFARFKSVNPPKVEQRGVENFEKLIVFLKQKGVEVTFVQPPFNPLYWDAVQGTPYMEGLTKIEKLTADMAGRHGINIIGGFNPRKVGCTKEQYIDAEHANAQCLQNIFDEFQKLDVKSGAL